MTRTRIDRWWGCALVLLAACEAEPWLLPDGWPEGVGFEVELSQDLAAVEAVVAPSPVQVGRTARCELLGLPDPVGVTAREWRLDGVVIGQGETIEAPDAPGSELSCTPLVWEQGVAKAGRSGVAPIVARPVAGDVLLIVADDVGVDRVGAYGVGVAPPPTPNLDALAAEGMRFNRVWATPSCSPTRATLLTGRHGFRTGVGQASAANDGYALELEEVTLAEMLGRASERYSSAMVGKWHLSNFAVGHGQHVLDQGFDRQLGNLGNLRNEEAMDGSVQGYVNYEYVVDGVVGRRTDYLTSVEADDAIAMITTLPSPWFVYLSFHAAHSPAHIPPRALYSGPTLVPGEANDLVRYDAMTEAMDAEIGRVLEVVPPETLVVVLGDNGTERNAVRGPYAADEVKLTMYEGGVRVPFLVRGPQVAVPGSTSDALISTVDLFPTLAELAGVDLAQWFPDLKIDGVSFAPVLADPSHPGARDVVYTERFLGNGFGPYTEHRRAVRDERFKLIWDMATGYQLYDLGLDWQEGEDLLQAEVLPADAEAAFERLAAELEGGRFRR
jgi:arylsulfatase A-like enzyme